MHEFMQNRHELLAITCQTYECELARIQRQRRDTVYFLVQGKRSAVYFLFAAYLL